MNQQGKRAATPLAVGHIERDYVLPELPSDTGQANLTIASPPHARCTLD